MKSLSLLTSYALNEIRVEDIWSKQFSVFRKKYKYFDTEGENKDKYFVSFTDHRKDPLEKALKQWEEVRHRDPIGLYTYPLELAIKAPMSMNYATSSKYLIVVKRTSDYVDLQNVTEDEFYSYAKKLYPDIEERLDFLKHGNASYFEDKFSVKDRWSDGVKFQWGKLLFYIIQHEIYKESDAPTTGGFSKRPVMVRSVEVNMDQTMRARKMGLKCLVDNPEYKNQAIIHSNEPEQAVFLTRDSFKIVDVYLMQPKEDAPVDLKIRYSQKVAGLVIKELGGHLNDPTYLYGALSVRIGGNTRDRKNPFIFEFEYEEDTEKDRKYQEYTQSFTDTYKYMLDKVRFYYGGVDVRLERFNEKLPAEEIAEKILRAYYGEITMSKQRTFKGLIANQRHVDDLAKLLGKPAPNLGKLKKDDSILLPSVITDLVTYMQSVLELGYRSREFTPRELESEINKRTLEDFQNKRVLDSILVLVSDALNFILHLDTEYRGKYGDYRANEWFFYGLHSYIKYKIQHAEEDKAKELEGAGV